MANVAAWIGYIALVAIVLLVLVDVFGRFFLNRPLKDAYELVVLSMTVLGGFAMMYTTVKWGHVSIDLITSRFPKSLQNTMQRITWFVGWAVWGVVAYNVMQTALENSVETAGLLRIPIWPFKFTLALGTFLFSLVLLVQALEAEHETKEEIQE